MHGEYKVPGGKLVVVDLEIVEGRIADFQLAGDFFLEPDSALEAIDAAVNGLPAEVDAKTIAAAVKEALPAGASLLGFSPEAVAVAVRRALAKATSWRTATPRPCRRNCTWRWMRCSPTRSARDAVARR